MGKHRTKISRQDRIKSLKEKREKEQALVNSLKKSGKRNKKERTLILINGIYKNEMTWYDFKTSSERKMHELFNQKEVKENDQFKRELHRVYTHLYLQGCHKIFANRELLAGIKNLVACKFFNDLEYLREPSAWKPMTKNPFKQFDSFVKHCWIKYDIPEFFYPVWLEEDLLAHRWFVLLGQGTNVRKLPNLPYNLTKKMAHEFIQAPKDLKLAQAFRWAQAKGFGANEVMAHKISKTKLTRLSLQYNEFWETVVHFFARQESMAMSTMQELLDYLNFVIHENPSYSMSKRKLETLVKQSDEWHKQMGYSKKKKWFAWPTSGVKEFRIEDIVNGKAVVYEIKELLSSQQLSLEGGKMRHCVATYDDNCKDRDSAIFSLRMIVPNKKDKILATMEVEFPEKEITQAKAKCNEDISEETRHIMTLWAELEGLKICQYL